MVTETGKVIDPLADKICLGVGLLYIFFKANINPVIVYVLIGRDLFILILGFLLSNKMGSVPSSNIWGKLTSFFLSILGVFAFLKVFYNTNFLSWCAFYLYFISFGFIVLSSISYFLRFIKIIKRWF